MQITNLTQSKIDKKTLVAAAGGAARILGGKKLDDLSLVFVGDARMKGINKKYRGKNVVTDVLSFEDLNEIYICLPQAKRQAKNNSLQPLLNLRGGGKGALKLREKDGKLLKTSLNLELTRLLVHGIVHLKGYDHEKSVGEAERMFKLEEKICKQIDLRFKNERSSRAR